MQPTKIEYLDYKMTNDEIEKEFKKEWNKHHTSSKEGDSCWICDDKKDEQLTAQHWYIAGRRNGMEV